MLDYKIEIFIRVAQAGNITRTARDLNISQPAVSTAIQKLEDQFGVKLFFRHARGLELTPAGAALYKQLRELKNRSIQVENELTDLRGTLRGHLRLGASPTFGEYILPGLLGKFSRRYPQISYSLEIGNNRQIYALLKEGEVELGFMAGKPFGRNLHAQKLLEDKLVLVVPAGHPWSGRKRIQKEELPELPLIVRERGSGSRQEMEEALSEMGLALERLTIIAEFYSLEAIKNAVEAGLGAAIISGWAIGKELRLKTLVPLEISGAVFNREIHAVYLYESRLAEAASRLLQLSANLAEEMSNCLE
jgi:DNA-binding transcriptional LysR family regulator